MRISILGLVLLGCGGTPGDARPGTARPASPPPSPAAPPAAVPSPGAPADAALATPPTAPPGFQPVEAPPGGKIVRVAATPASDAALTVDDADEVRLWPTLDGTHPPRAVDLPAARGIALQRDGADFIVIAILDGGAALVRLDERGHRLAVRELPAADGVAAVGGGFVTWRGARLDWIDLGGIPRATLDARARVSGVVTAGDVAIATVGGARRALVLRRPDGQAPELALTGSPPRPATPVVSAHHSDLVIATSDGPRYLGYAYLASEAVDLRDPAHALVGGAAGWLQIDPGLAEVRELVPPAAVHAASIAWLAGDDWLLAGPAGLWVWTAGQPTATLARPKARIVEYNADSRLALLDGKRLARYAPDRRTFDDVAFTAWGGAAVEPHLLSPARAHGARLLLTAFWRDTQGVAHGSAQWIHDLAHPELAPTWSGVQAWPVGNTEAGRVQINDQSEPAHTRWQEVEDGVVLRGQVDEHVLTSPDGTRGLQLDPSGRTFALTDRAGHVAWTLTVPGRDPAYRDAQVWLDASHAWLLGPHGLVAIDLARGAFGRAVTGWRFELGRAPHPTSELGRPFALDLASGRDGPLAFPGDAAFQTLVTEVAARTNTRVLWWGPVALDGAVRRAAMLQDPADSGDALFAAVVELAPDKLVAVTISAWGSPRFQGPFPPTDPAWGTAIADETGPQHAHTIDFASLDVGSKWIHGSFERLSFTLERGRFAVVANSWEERENNGHGFDESSDHKTFAPGHRPSLATYKAHAMRIAISAPERSAEALAAGIHPLPVE